MPHPVDLPDVRQAELVLDLIRHGSARRGDHQVHQLERRKAWHVLDVDPSRHLGGQHGLGLVKGPVAGNVECFPIGNIIRKLNVARQRVIIAPNVAFAAPCVAFAAPYVADRRSSF